MSCSDAVIRYTGFTGRILGPCRPPSPQGRGPHSRCARTACAVAGLPTPQPRTPASPSVISHHPGESPQPPPPTTCSRSWSPDSTVAGTPRREAARASRPIMSSASTLEWRARMREGAGAGRARAGLRQQGQAVAAGGRQSVEGWSRTTLCTAVRYTVLAVKGQTHPFTAQYRSPTPAPTWARTRAAAAWVARPWL